MGAGWRLFWWAGSRRASRLHNFLALLLLLRQQAALRRDLDPLAVTVDEIVRVLAHLGLGLGLGLGLMFGFGLALALGSGSGSGFGFGLGFGLQG